MDCKILFNLRIGPRLLQFSQCRDTIALDKGTKERQFSYYAHILYWSNLWSLRDTLAFIYIIASRHGHGSNRSREQPKLELEPVISVRLGLSLVKIRNRAKTNRSSFKFTLEPIFDFQRNRSIWLHFSKSSTNPTQKHQFITNPTQKHQVIPTHNDRQTWGREEEKSEKRLVVREKIQL